MSPIARPLRCRERHDRGPPGPVPVPEWRLTTAGLCAVQVPIVVVMRPLVDPYWFILLLLFANADRLLVAIVVRWVSPKSLDESRPCAAQRRNALSRRAWPVKNAPADLNRSQQKRRVE